MTDRRAVLKGGVGLAAASMLAAVPAPAAFAGGYIPGRVTMLVDPRFVESMFWTPGWAEAGNPEFRLDGDIAELWLGPMREAARLGGIAGTTLYSDMMISEVFGREIGLRPLPPLRTMSARVGGSAEKSVELWTWALARPEGRR